jgi:hypothetical protein
MERVTEIKRFKPYGVVDRWAVTTNIPETSAILRTTSDYPFLSVGTGERKIECK